MRRDGQSVELTFLAALITSFPIAVAAWLGWRGGLPWAYATFAALAFTLVVGLLYWSAERTVAVGAMGGLFGSIVYGAGAHLLGPFESEEQQPSWPNDHGVDVAIALTVLVAVALEGVVLALMVAPSVLGALVAYALGRSSQRRDHGAQEILLIIGEGILIVTFIATMGTWSWVDLAVALQVGWLLLALAPFAWWLGRQRA